jgi:acetyl esterase/lipase
VSAYRWLAAQRGADRIILAGDSASAGLACSLMLTLGEPGEPLPAGAVFLCPGVDPSGNTILNRVVDPDPAQVEQLERVADAYLSGHPPDDPIVNALVADLTGLPPMLIQAATGDLIRPDAEAFAARPSTAWTRGSSSTRPRRTSSTSSGRSCPRPPTRVRAPGAFIRARLAGEPERLRDGA